MNLTFLSSFFMHPTVLVGFGGACGSIARYGIGRWCREQAWAQSFFWGTFTINVSGSLLLGVVAALFKDRVGTGYLLLGTGLCGGFTTFSTFSLEIVEHIHKSRWDLAIIYTLSSVLCGVLGFISGLMIVNALQH